MIRTSILSCTINDIFGTYVLTDTITPIKLINNISELVYSYPLLKSSTIHNCNINIDDQHFIEAKIMKKDKAINKFEDNIAKNRIGCLIDVSDDVVKIELANLPANLYFVTVKIHFVQINSCIGNNIIHFDVSNMRVDRTILKYSFNSELVGIEGNHIQHFGEFTLSKQPDTIEVEREVYFKFNKLCSAAWSSTINTPKGPARCILVNVVPDLPVSTKLNTEFCVFVDCSGSMAGKKMEQCIIAMKLLIASLPLPAKVTIYSFATNFKKCTFTSDQKDQMIEFVKQFKADGMTYIENALENAYSCTPNAISFIITDGVFNDASQVRQRVINKNSPLFIIGIGEDVDSTYLQGLINEVGGRFNKIPQIDILSLKEIVVAHLLNAMHLDKIKIQVSHKQIETFPKIVWNLHDQHNLKYICVDARSNTSTVRVDGKLLQINSFADVDKVVMGKFIQMFNQSDKQKAINASICVNILSNYTLFVGKGSDVGSIGIRANIGVVDTRGDFMVEDRAESDDMGCSFFDDDSDCCEAVTKTSIPGPIKTGNTIGGMPSIVASLFFPKLVNNNNTIGGMPSILASPFLPKLINNNNLEYTFNLTEVTIKDEIMFAKINGSLIGASPNQVVTIIIGNHKYKVQVMSTGSDVSPWSVLIL